jgi:hypothetical protein
MKVQFNSQEEKKMTRINSSGTTGPQPIQSQDAASQNVSKTQKTEQGPNAAEQQQGKQAAQGRKSDIDLQGTIKQSELAQFHGPGGSHSKGSGERGNVSAMDDSKSQQIQDVVKGAVAGAIVAGPSGALSGAMVGSAPKDPKEIELEKWYYEMMKSQQLERDPRPRIDKAENGHGKKSNTGGMHMTPFEAEHLKNAEKAEKAQKIKNAVEPIITGTIVGGPAGAAIGSIIGTTPKFEGEQAIVKRLEDWDKQFQEMLDTRDPISGEKIIDLETGTASRDQTKETKDVEE